MKKLTFILLLIPIFSNAQIRRTEYDSAWQRQFNLNQGFGTNINTLLTANGERRRQVERLQLDSAIDYLQKIRCKAESREAEMTEISGSLFDIAGELGIAILLLSQVNADGDTKHGIVTSEDCDGYLLIER